jgi:DNA gyrase/topoisomerase IV subunit B
MSDELSKLSKVQKEAIENRANEIKTIKDFVEIVRKRPGMYLGPIGNAGFLNMIREIVQNSFDQLTDPLSPATYVIVTYDELTKEVIVEDNGMGIPHGHLIRVFAEQNTSSHYEAKEGVFQAGLHGVGSKVTNAMSSKFKVESYVLGKGRMVEFIDGKPTDEGEVEIPNPGKQGTVVYFTPSIEALGPITLTSAEVFNLLSMILCLMNIGTRLIYNSISIDRKVNRVELINENGLLDLLVGFTPTLKNHIIIKNESPTMKMECCINFDAEFNTSVLGFANFCPTASGTHINGFIEGVCLWFKNYMNNYFLSNANSAKNKNTKDKANTTNKLSIELVDVGMALRAVIHAAHIEPNFTGQAKENLSNPEMKTYVKNAVMQGLDEWCSKNPQDLQKVCKFIKGIAELRISGNKEKQKLTNKYASSITGLPVKLVRPTAPRSMWEEFWVVEGDSALGTGKNARIKQIQALLPVRGKLLNAFKHPVQKILDNDECNGILNTIGGGYGKNFDLSKVIWKKVGVMADADVDGGHIASLFLIFMLVYCRPLVEDGRVYKAVPPLYGAKINSKMVYFTNKIDYVKYVQKKFLENHTLTDVIGKPLSNLEIIDILYKNEDYVFEVENIADTYDIDPILLETVLLNKGINAAAAKRLLKGNDRFRFVKDIRDMNNTVIFDAG